VGMAFKLADISNHWHSFLEYFCDDFLTFHVHLFQVGQVEEAHTGLHRAGKSPDQCNQSTNLWYPLAVSVMVIAMLLVLVVAGGT
jgi:hypothetical protein